MALAIASKSTANGTAGDVTITKPTNLAVGDLMIAAITSATGGTGEAHSGPSGWTKIEEQVPVNGTILTIWAVVVTSTQTAASDFSWTSAGTNENTTGFILRITGSSAFASLAQNVVSDSANTNTYPLPDFSGITTTTANSLLLIIGASEIIDGDIDFSGYAVANNNPSWTEEYDIYYEPGGVAINLAVASATYAPVQATGDFSIDASQDGGDASVAIIAVAESTSVTVSPAVINSTISVQGPSVSGGANVSPAVIDLTASIQAPTVATAASKVKNVSKSTESTVQNLDKSA